MRTGKSKRGVEPLGPDAHRVGRALDEWLAPYRRQWAIRSAGKRSSYLQSLVTILETTSDSRRSRYAWRHMSAAGAGRRSSSGQR